MNTVGYKRQRAEFQDLLYQNVERMGAQSSTQGTVVPTGIQIGAGVKAGAVYRVTDQGTPSNTGGMYDMAIDGRGYFQVLLPSGDLLILERKFSWLGGVGIRIRRLVLSDIAPGAVVDGPAIFNADLGNEIDNMEGIDAHVSAEGETVLTMVSDDNFSLIQRNLLLQFTLVE